MRDFNYTIGVLVSAYLNDTLKHGSCRACAVGNIVGHSDWSRFFITPSNDGITLPQVIAGPNEHISIFSRSRRPTKEKSHQIYLNELREKIETQSGYTIAELARIENAFEAAPKGKDNDDWMFNGLMEVVNVLADIHGIDLTIREETKKLFRKEVTHE